MGCLWWRSSDGVREKSSAPLPPRRAQGEEKFSYELLLEICWGIGWLVG